MINLSGIGAGLAAIPGGYQGYQDHQLQELLRRLGLDRGRMELEDAARERAAMGAAFNGFTDPGSDFGMLPGPGMMPGPQPVPVGPGEQSMPRREMGSAPPTEEGARQDSAWAGTGPAFAPPSMETGAQPSPATANGPLTRTPAQMPPNGPNGATPPLYPAAYSLRGLAAAIKRSNPGIDNATAMQALMKVSGMLDGQSKLALSYMLRTKPSALIENYLFRQALPPAQQQVFDRVQRADQYLNTGPEFVNPRDPNNTGRIPIRPKPSEEPEFIGDQERERGRAGADVKREEGRTKAETALRSFEQQSTLVTKNIDEALGIIASSPNATGWWGSMLSGLPIPSDARRLKNVLDTIKANVGFDKLEQMRQNSPTGGALGQITDFENRLLQAVQGALDPIQKDQLQQNLNTIKELYPQVLAERQRAFQQDYANVAPRGRGPTTPATPAPRAGATPPARAAATPAPQAWRPNPAWPSAQGQQEGATLHDDQDKVIAVIKGGRWSQP